MAIKALITDLAGERLSAEEKRFLQSANPYGIILFARNCIAPPQLRALVDEVKDALGRDNLPVLIDQEGGRVARLKPPHWRDAPSAARLSRHGQEAVYLNARLMAEELSALGITVNCAPVADVPVQGAHAVIGERAYGTTPGEVAANACAMAQGLLDGGVIPVVKHIPGHGRARADSHEELPVVDAPLELLRETDFAAFRALAHLPMAMTAHVVYTAIDRARAATLSPDVIRVIREEIGFNGLLMTDAIDMKALAGALEDRARDALNAGCDVVLHCNAPLDERQAVADACAAMTDAALARSERAFSMAKRKRDGFAAPAAQARLDTLLAA